MDHAFFVHFFAVTSGLRRESASFYGVLCTPATQRTWTQDNNFLSLFFLFSTAFLEFNSRKICQQLTDWTSSFTLSVTERVKLKTRKNRLKQLTEIQAEKTEVDSNTISTQSSSAHVEERDQAHRHWGREWVEHNEVMKHCACFVTKTTEFNEFTQVYFLSDYILLITHSMVKLPTTNHL